MANSSPWNDDLLEFSKIGSTFTNLIKSLDTEKLSQLRLGLVAGRRFFERHGPSNLEMQVKM